MSALIDQNTLIDYGLGLSKNFALEHMSTGAFNNVLGKITPTFPAKLLPWQNNGMFSSDIPLWKLVQNLQVGAMGIMENMVTALGSDLNVMAGFLNNAPQTVSQIAEMGHTVGTSVDIAVSNFMDNPYIIGKDIARIAANAQNIDIIYNAGISFFHIDLKTAQGQIIPRMDGPILRSINIATGESGLGNIPFFGMV